MGNYNQIALPIQPADEKIRKAYLSFRLYFANIYDFEEAKIFEAFGKARQQAYAIKQLFEINYNEWNW